MTWGYVAVGAGTAIAGSSGKKASKNASKAANMQADIANRLFQETDPLRAALIGRSANFLGAPMGASPSLGANPSTATLKNGIQVPLPQQAGAASPAVAGAPGSGFDVTSTPTFADYKNVADRSFARAKDNAIATLPSGGGLTSALVNLEGQRADNLTQGAGNIYDAELARAMTLATGQTGVAMGGLGQAANAQALAPNAASQQSAAKSGALGTGLGAYMGQKNSKPTTTGGGSSTGKG